jgi:hypothetical protein
MEPVRCDHYNDTLRVMYCVSTTMLRSRFLQAMNAMANVIGLNRIPAPSAPDDDYLNVMDEYKSERIEVM